MMMLLLVSKRHCCCDYVQVAQVSRRVQFVRLSCLQSHDWMKRVEVKTVKSLHVVSLSQSDEWQYVRLYSQIVSNEIFSLSPLFLSLSLSLYSSLCPSLHIFCLGLFSSLSSTSAHYRDDDHDTPQIYIECTVAKNIMVRKTSHH